MGTGLIDTAQHREQLQRKFCAPISAEMRTHAFPPERYLFCSPHGTGAEELRSDALQSESRIPTLRRYAIDT